MQGFLQQCIDRSLDLAEVDVSTLNPAYTPCLDEHNMNQDDYETSGYLAPVAASIVMKILYMARSCRFDLLYPVCSLAREVSKWSKASNKSYTA